MDTLYVHFYACVERLVENSSAIHRSVGVESIVNRGAVRIGWRTTMLVPVTFLTVYFHRAKIWVAGASKLWHACDFASAPGQESCKLNDECVQKDYFVTRETIQLKITSTPQVLCPRSTECSRNWRGANRSWVLQRVTFTCGNKSRKEKVGFFHNFHKFSSGTCTEATFQRNKQKVCFLENENERRRFIHVKNFILRALFI